MGLNKEFMIVFLLLGPMLFITLTIHGWDFYQRNIAPETTERQRLRKDLLRKHCASENQSLVSLNNIDLNNFIVDDKHGIIYCYIPKVACTNWKRTLIALKHDEPYPDPMSFKGDWVHKFDRFRLLKHFPIQERKAKLQHYTKFLFVRDPFVRLISAFRDKIQHYDKYFYDGYIRVMLQRYNSQNVVKNNGTKSKYPKPSFHNFIQYIVDPRTERYAPFEPHWRQMHRLCHPCLIDYDLIGHQETLQEDAQELLKMLKLEVDIKFPPSYENMTSHNSITDWFQSVPLEDRRKLYKVYEKDFQLFGYRRPTELLDE